MTKHKTKMHLRRLRQHQRQSAFSYAAVKEMAAAMKQLNRDHGVGRPT